MYIENNFSSLTKFIKHIQDTYKPNFRLNDIFKSENFKQKINIFLKNTGYDECKEKPGISFFRKNKLAYRIGSREGKEWFISNDLLILIAAEIIPEIYMDIFMGKSSKEELIEKIYNICPTNEKEKNTKTYIAIDKSTNIYKIGKSIDISKRESSMKTGNAYISIIAYIDKNIEDELHEKFNDYNITGEWFNITEQVVRHIIDTYGFTCISIDQTHAKRKTAPKKRQILKRKQRR